MKKITILLTITILLFCTACDNSAFSLAESSTGTLYEENIDSSNNNDSLDDNIVQVDWEHNKVYKWKDYFETAENPIGEDFEIKIKIADFPDTVFIWRAFGISSYENGEGCVLASGMPLWNAFFTDLNSDGFPELCTTVSMGSGIIDEHIIVYDYHNEKRYILEDRMNFDYSLFLENDELYVWEVPYMRDENSRANIGKLAIENDELVIKQ